MRGDLKVVSVKGKWSIVLFALAVVIGAVAFFQNQQASGTEKKNVKQDTNYKDVEIVTLVNDGKFMRYAVNYPLFHQKELDDKIQSYANSALEHFKKTFSEAKDIDENKRYELNIDYEMVHYAKQSAAIRFTTYTYTGQQSGTTNHLTINFDFQKKTFLDTKDLFLPKTNYLKKLSYITYTELRKDKTLSKDQPLLQKGTAPDAQNFSQFALKDKYVEFYFPASQVAAEDLGPQTLAIKKTLLKDILKPEYMDKLKNKNEMKEPNPKRKAVKLPQKSKLDPNKKAIALTFDDGPNPATTTKILDALKKNKGHATFFVLGSRVQYYPGMLADILKGGNEIGNHSYNHPLLTRLSLDEAVKQVKDTQQLIEKASGYTPTHFRPPYGGTNQDINHAIGMKVTLWDVDPEDWKIRNSQQITNRVLSHAADGRTVLMHDIYESSAQAAVKIIHELTKQGYQLVTVSELEQLKKERHEQTPVE
ncbi:polysaccharide deacetylase family protein [Bacillus safensis]|nr:polysaccharide deacetylase family protein [Bacillus safensis]MCM2986482.1 polysaccharide deacetylase family protein [Bacillus safensis]MCY7445601.1 polysaccharide deacetylase family protein [Bacillus safensis]MCY7456542.1 polysaccharide deacetylase family protein [Bacillus safensis]MCY7465114.1 polysaccharide deacetylase family protein [Bacillus safensis]